MPVTSWLYSNLRISIWIISGNGVSPMAMKSDWTKLWPGCHIFDGTRPFLGDLQVDQWFSMKCSMGMRFLST